MMSGLRKGLCPVSLGLALGITSALAVFIWTAWIINYGVPADMAAYIPTVPTWQDGMMHALWALLKGFAFGFVLALFYDMFCCLKSMCCKKSGSQGCGCGCGCTDCKCNMTGRPGSSL